MPSLSETLLRLRATPEGRRTLLSLDAHGEACRLCEEDPYGENTRMQEALARLGVGDSGALRLWYGHLLTCMKREAAYLEHSGSYCTPSIEYQGERWLAETEGQPTLLVSPMTQALPDVLEVMSRLPASRPLIVYGESLSVDADPRLAHLSAGEGLAAVRRIGKVLRDKGILCTYLDFVYEGHMGVTVSMFGRPRPLSSGFVSLAARHGAMLLPVVIRSVDDMRGERLRVLFEEPVAVPRLTEAVMVSERPYLAQSMADMLSDLILRCPSQWLLLPTITFDMPQMTAVGQ